MKKRNLWLLTLSSAVLVSGCATMKVPEFNVQPAESYQYKAETNGVLVAVDPVTDKKEIEQDFRTDLLKKGVVPILVVIENHSSSSYMVDKQKVYVVSPKGGEEANSDLKNVRSGSGGEKTALAGSALLGAAVIAAPAAVVVAAPLLIAGMKSMSNSDVIKYNLHDKELASHTIDPGKSAHGYIYFQLPPGEQFTGRRQVLVQLTNLSTDRPLTFLFNVQ